MAEYKFLFDGERLADHARKANAAFERGVAGLHRWAENMATAANAQLLRAWIFGELDERPTRGDIKSWVATSLAELDRVDALVRELGAELARACEERDETLDALAAEREAHDADVAQLGDERDELRRKLRAAHCERDALQTLADSRRRKLDHLARHVACEVVECEHGVRVTVRPHGSTSALLRLPNEVLEPETLVVDNWEETDGGVVTVTAHRAEKLTWPERVTWSSGAAPTLPKEGGVK